MCAFVCSFDVDFLDQIPVQILHVLEANISQNTGVVNEDVDSAEGLNRGVNNGNAILNAVVVGNSLSASSLNLVDDYISSLCCGC